MEQGAGALDAKLWSRTWVTWMGFALGLGWLAIGAVMLAGMIGGEELHLYMLGYRRAEAEGTLVGNCRTWRRACPCAWRITTSAGCTVPCQEPQR